MAEIGYQQSKEGVQEVMLAEENVLYTRCRYEKDPETDLRRIVKVRAHPNGEFKEFKKSEFAENITDPTVKLFINSGRYYSTVYSEAHSDPSVLGSATQPGGPKFWFQMMHNPNHIRAGRAGHLMVEQDGEVRPAIVTRNGREFLIDSKGIGTPSGELNYINDGSTAIGGMINGMGQREYDALAIASKQHPLNNKGIVPFPLGIGKLDSGLEVVYRAVPTTMRASFEGDNVDAFRKVDQTKITSGMGKEFGRYLGMTPTMYVKGLQRENGYLVNVGETQEFIATDFNEILPLHRRLTPFYEMEITFEVVAQSVPEVKNPIQTFAVGISNGLKQSGTACDFGADLANSNSSSELTQKLFDNLLAERIVEERKREKFQVTSEMIKKLALVSSIPVGPWEVETFLKDELTLLKSYQRVHKADPWVMRQIDKVEKASAYLYEIRETNFILTNDQIDYFASSTDYSS